MLSMDTLSEEPVEALLLIADEFNHEQLHAVAILAFTAMVAKSNLKMGFSFSHQCGSIGARLTLDAQFNRYGISSSDGHVYRPDKTENCGIVRWETTSNHTIEFILYRDSVAVILGEDQSEVFYAKVRRVLGHIPSGVWEGNVWSKTYLAD